MPAKFHTKAPDAPSRCTCGYVYPAHRRGGVRILQPGRWAAVIGKAAAGMPFARNLRRDRAELAHHAPGNARMSGLIRWPQAGERFEGIAVQSRWKSSEACNPVVARAPQYTIRGLHRSVKRLSAAPPMRLPTS